jgi:DNA-binding GntR family transcriptional regulator
VIATLFTVRTHVIDRGLPTPVYQQVYEILRGEILARELPPNRLIPSNRELQDRFKVKRGSVARAVAQLQSDGLAVFVRGKGVAVVPEDQLPS